MQLGVFAKTFTGTDPLTVLTKAKVAVFSCVQYNMACSGLNAMPDEISDEIALAVSNASAATGIGIAAVSGTYNMVHPDVSVRQLGLRRLEVLAAGCAAMGTRLITLCTGSRDADDQWRHHAENQSVDAWDDLLFELTAAIEIAERYDVDFGIEPELANVVNSAQRAQKLIDDLGSVRIKIVFDPANLFEVVDTAEQLRIVSAAIDDLGDRIVMGHAKDRTIDGRFTTAGKGCLDYEHYFSALKAIGFSGPMITHGLDADEAAGVAEFLKEAMK
jgi:sugar phosphate isomerase/epimerase